MKSAAPDAHVADLVRNAGVCQGRRGRLLLSTRAKFKTRYSTLGFSDKAQLDDGDMWPVAYALKALTPWQTKRASSRL